MSFRSNRAKISAAVRILQTLLLFCCIAAPVDPHAYAQTSVDGEISGFVVDLRRCSHCGRRRAGS